MDKIVHFDSFLTTYKSIINKHIDNYSSFLTTYRINLEKFFIDIFSDYENRFSNFSTNYNLLLKYKIDTDDKNAWDFSIFNIVKINRPEENLHSPLIKELINTTGTHGQKDLFYKLFIRSLLPESDSVRFINENNLDYLIKT